MKPIGYGAFPYDCETRRKYPTAMVYESDGCGHSGWACDATDIEAAAVASAVAIGRGEIQA